MDQDDIPLGRILSRRELLTLLGASGMALLVGGQLGGRAEAGEKSAAPCVVRPEQTEGPYFVDERLNRSDIRSDPAGGALKAGVPLRLAMKVSRLAGSRCVPLPGARVDVWHCDALGVYSDVSDPGFDSHGQKFLRGYQVTDAGGTARFTTIYPGWYEGRTVHIHFKIRSGAGASRAHEFTSQLYFDDALTDRVHARAPYVAKGRRTIRNADDGLFADGGRRLLLAPVRSRDGYAATFDVALQTA